MSSNQPQSPCIGVCQLVENTVGDSICKGCFRSVTEIAAWSTMSDAQKQQVLDRLQTLKSTTELETKLS